MEDATALLAANEAFYRAITTSDYAAMAKLWAEEDVSCIHPGWPALIGRERVLASFANIMGNPQQPAIVFQAPTIILRGDNGRVIGVEFVSGAYLMATNIFERSENIWKIVHHQSSQLANAPRETAPEPASRRLH